MENLYREMGTRIKARRKSLKIKQLTLAEMLGISNNHMSSIENGKVVPSLDIFVNICKSLGLRPDYLLLGTMYSDDVSMNIPDKLRLCSPADLMLANDFIELLVARNKDIHTDFSHRRL